jgi:hypothetical protein
MAARHPATSDRDLLELCYLSADFKEGVARRIEPLMYADSLMHKG